MSEGSQLPPRPQRKPGGFIFYGWYIVAAGALIQAFGYGARYSFSVFFPTLIAEFHWPRDLAASILSTHLLFYGLMAPFAGYLVDRFGPRRAMLAGTTLLSSGLFLARFGNSPWQFYLTFGVLAGPGLCLLGSVPLTMVVRNWFERRRGLALSFIYFGTGLAYGCYPAVAWLIKTLGWRNAFVVEAALVAAIFVPIVTLVIEYHPIRKGLRRDGLLDGGQKVQAILEREARRIVDPDWVGQDWTIRRALGRARFWLLALTTFSIWGVGHHILVTHQVAFAIDMGFTPLHASAILSLNGLAYGLGCIFSLVSDRIGREATMGLGTAICLVGLAALAFIKDASQPWLLYHFALVFGFGYGMYAPAIAASVTDIFQGAKVGPIIGGIWFGFSLGGTIGPWLGGWLFELTGNYALAFSVATAMLLVGTVATYLAAPRKVRLVPGKLPR